MNMRESNIPTSPLRVSVTSLGWMPDVALHRYRRLFIHEASYASLILAAGMFVIAVVFCFLPWNEPILPGSGLPTKYVIALMFHCGAVGSVAVFFFRNHYGQRLKIDPATQTVTLRKSRSEAVLHWLVGQVLVADRIRQGERVPRIERETQPEAVVVMNFSDVVGIQICGSPPLAYQVNLVFRTSSGGLDRDCLANHVVKKYCTALAKQYADEFGFKLIDNIDPFVEQRAHGRIRNEI